MKREASFQVCQSIAEWRRILRHIGNLIINHGV
jgi:hypothetical protein